MTEKLKTFFKNMQPHIAVDCALHDHNWRKSSVMYCKLFHVLQTGEHYMQLSMQHKVLHTFGQWKSSTNEMT